MRTKESESLISVSGDGGGRAAGVVEAKSTPMIGDAVTEGTQASATKYTARLSAQMDASPTLPRIKHANLCLDVQPSEMVVRTLPVLTVCWNVHFPRWEHCKSDAGEKAADLPLSSTVRSKALLKHRPLHPRVVEGTTETSLAPPRAKVYEMAACLGPL